MRQDEHLGSENARLALHAEHVHVRLHLVSLGAVGVAWKVTWDEAL
jgi:hypothetical protein